MITTSARTFFRRRPILTGSCISCTSFASFAILMEYRAEQQKSEWLSKRELSNSVGLLMPPPLLPRAFDSDAIYRYWSIRPVSTMKRLLEILIELSPIAVKYITNFLIFESDDINDSFQTQRILASELREALTNLGPGFVKAGQQLSIRPDLVSPVVLKELQGLCDSVRPIPDEIALDLIRKQLNDSDNTLFISTPSLVASASLGQVYKATIRESGEVVAIKVQRPGMLESFSLDIYLLQHIGGLVDLFTSVFTNQPPFHKPLYDSFAKGSYGELDYEQEAKNQLEFRHELLKRNCPVIIPSVYTNLTTQYVLTTEWIEGKKLVDAPRDQIQQLIPVGVELFLTQLLDLGKFHSDPHPGNLLVNEDGKLCLLDFGLCADVDERYRSGMTKAIVHLITKDFDTLISQDAKELGFLPHDFDTTELKPLLTKILTVGLVESGSDLHKRKRKLLEISNELNEVFFRYPFSVPPFFALITRGLGLLEGIALTGDPDFDIFKASAPYARKRAASLFGPEQYFQLLTRRSTKF